MCIKDFWWSLKEPNSSPQGVHLSSGLGSGCEVVHFTSASVPASGAKLGYLWASYCSYKPKPVSVVCDFNLILS